MMLIAAVMGLAGCGASDGLPATEWQTYDDNGQAFEIQVAANKAATYADAAAHCSSLGAALPTEPDFVTARTMGFYGMKVPTAPEWFLQAGGTDLMSVMAADTKSAQVVTDDATKFQYRCARVVD